MSPDTQNFYEDIINSLKELDEIDIEIDKKTKEIIREQVVGTKGHLIKGILDRVNLLIENVEMKYMYKKNCKDNINLVDCIENNKVILIKMPEDVFNNIMIKNVLTTYWVSKVLLATKIRGSRHDKPNRCNLIIDEIFQSYQAEYILKYALPQLRKFGLKVVLSCHWLKQIDIIRNELKNAGASYVLLHGADKINYDELAEELQPYTLEDLMNVKQYHALNLILYEKGYAKFITELPKPL